MADVINSATGELIVWSLDIVSAHTRGFGADGVVSKGCPVGLSAVIDLVEAAVRHEAGEFHVVVDGVVDGLDAICVVNGELWVKWSLDIFIDNTYQLPLVFGLIFPVGL